MSNTVDLLEIEVLKLGALERTRILESLIASLDDSSAIETDWLAEAQRREAAGDEHMLDGASVLQELRARYA